MEDLLKFPVCKHITGYSFCAEGENQWKFSRFTVNVTGKVTAVSLQSP